MTGLWRQQNESPSHTDVQLFRLNSIDPIDLTPVGHEPASSSESAAEPLNALTGLV